MSNRCVDLLLDLQFNPLIDLCVFMLMPHSIYYYYSVVQFEIRDGDTPRSPSIVQDYFSNPGFFVCFFFSYEVKYLQ